MSDLNKIGDKDAKNIGKELGISWDDYSFDEFLMGINVELEHGTAGKWNVSEDDLAITAKIALAHLDELPDYYTRLIKMEQEGKEALKENDTDTTDNSEAGSEDRNGDYSESLAQKLKKVIREI